MCLPVLFTLFQEPFPWPVAIGDSLSKGVEDEDIRLWYAMFRSKNGR
jgi:hypothetical protein